MPPQVGGVGGGSGSIVQSAPSPEDQKVESKGSPKTDNASGASKSKKTTSTSSSQSPKQPEDAKTAGRAAHGSKQNAIDKQGQHKVQEKMVQKNLQKQIPVVNQQKKLEQSVDATGLKKGESISARVDNKPDGFHFEFERPITKEQAGAIIFHKEKVPEHASLEGSGKSWLVKVPYSVEVRQKTVAHFTKHTETTKPPEKRQNDVYASDPELKFKWVGGDLLTTNQRMEQLMEEREKRINELMESMVR